jgi:hypothetical protein
MKDLYLYTNPDKLYNQKLKSTSGAGSNTEMVFSEDKKLPMHLGICPALSFEYSENAFKLLNGKVI